LSSTEWEQAAVIFAGFNIAALYTPLADASTWLFAKPRPRQRLVVCEFAGSLITVASFRRRSTLRPCWRRHRLSAAVSWLGCRFFTILQDDKGLSLQLICGSEFSATFRFGQICLRRDLVDAPTFLGTPLRWCNLVLCAPVGLLAG